MASISVNKNIKSKNYVSDQHPTVTMDIIKENLDLNQNWYSIADNPNLSEALGTDSRPELAVTINFVIAN